MIKVSAAAVRELARCRGLMRHEMLACFYKEYPLGRNNILCVTALEQQLWSALGTVARLSPGQQKPTAQQRTFSSGVFDSRACRDPVIS